MMFLKLVRAKQIKPPARKHSPKRFDTKIDVFCSLLVYFREGLGAGARAGVLHICVEYNLK